MSVETAISSIHKLSVALRSNDISASTPRSRADEIVPTDGEFADAVRAAARSRSFLPKLWSGMVG